MLATSILVDALPCEISDVLGIIGKDGVMAEAPKHAAALISARLAACSEVISKYLAGLPTQAPSLRHAVRYEIP